MYKRLIIALLVGGVLAGCRGMESDEPPVHPNPNMDWQERFNAQETNPLFDDNASMRTPPSGTVARGLLKSDSRFYDGRTEDGAYVEQAPVPVTRALAERGQERYNVYCSVCHGRAGDGNGIIMTGNYDYTPAPSFHDEAVRERMAADGYVFDALSNGIRTMPGYAQQIPVSDRWAIVVYIRALQRSQNASEGDVPENLSAQFDQVQEGVSASAQQ